jgi:hypothetical protein
MARTLVPKPAAGIMPLRTIVEDTIALHLYVTQHNFVGILAYLIHRFPLVSKRKLFFELQMQFYLCLPSAEWFDINHCHASVTTLLQPLGLNVQLITLLGI